MTCLWVCATQKAHHQLSMVVPIVGELFGVLGCDNADGADLLRDTGITPSTLMPHLGIIEQRLHDIIAQYAATLPKKGGSHRSVCVHTPWFALRVLTSCRSDSRQGNSGVGGEHGARATRPKWKCALGRAAAAPGRLR